MMTGDACSCAGIGRFYDNIKMMLGWQINPYMWISWTVVTPVYCLVRILSAAEGSD